TIKHHDTKTFWYLIVFHFNADWSMQVQAEVRGMDGYPVVLPCTFSHPQHSQHSLLQVMWRLGHGSAAAILYRCTSRPGAAACEPDPQQDQRYRLEGNPREHDLSLRINGATLQDNGRYYCRVEVQGREHVSFEDKMGTRLRVEAPPKILAVSVEGGGPAGFTAVCRVQGSPLPDIQWLGPDAPLEGSSPAPPQALGSPVIGLHNGRWLAQKRRNGEPHGGVLGRRQHGMQEAAGALALNGTGVAEVHRHSFICFNILGRAVISHPDLSSLARLYAYRDFLSAFNGHGCFGLIGVDDDESERGSLCNIYHRIPSAGGSFSLRDRWDEVLATEFGRWYNQS
uniref:Ig-like domain-containing protein n=1 Tax=Poecilia reticulata TaxID=8081 RepID=A0A3P9PHA4_POERE